MDQNSLNIIDRYVTLNTKTSPDATPLCSIVAQGDNIYMQERKFDPDTGVEASPLLTQIDLTAMTTLQDEITTFSDALAAINVTTANIAKMLPSIPTKIM